MFDVILDSCMDTLKAFPILLAAYIIIEFLERRLHDSPKALQSAERLGPFFGAILGCVPQCGFSAASSVLYTKGFLASGTLIAVFLSTSDEAIPLMLSGTGGMGNVLLLIICKLIIAVFFGYLYQWTIFRNERIKVSHHAPDTCTHTHDCSCGSTSFLGSVLMKTIKISLFLLVSILFINLSIFFIGEDRLSTLLLSGSIFQPALCALIGIIPGCAISVFLTELFLRGSISFGAAIAGLCTGAGFGYILLFQGTKNRRKAVIIVALTYLAAVISGTILQIIM